MLLLSRLSIKTQFLLWQKEESRRFTPSILELRDWSSDLKMIDEIATSMDGCSALILPSKPATLFFIFFGWSIFKMLVPTCRIIFFGFRLITGFAKSTMSSMVAPEKEKALTFWFLDNFLPMMFLVMESPMTTTSGGLFWSCLLWLAMLLPEATPLCPEGFFFFFGCTVSQDLEAVVRHLGWLHYFVFLPCSLTSWSSDDFFIEPLPDTRLSLSSSSVFMRSKSSSYEGVNSRFF